MAAIGTLGIALGGLLLAAGIATEAGGLITVGFLLMAAATLAGLVGSSQSAY